MKKTLFCIAALALALSMASCGNKEGAAKEGAKKENAKKATAKKGTSKKKSLLMPNASGLPYEMLVVMDDAQWDRPLGRAVFNVLDSDVPGLPQSERSFRISRVEPDGFNSNMFKIMRNVTKVDIQNIYTQPKFKFARNVYSYPQMIMTLQAPDEESLTEYINNNQQSIIDFFTKAEMNREIENLRERHNPEVSRLAEEILDVDIWVPWELNKFKRG